MPPMRDRQTMARRVRGYVTQAKASNGGSVAPELVKAHDVLDREVDKAFGAPRKLTTERQRQELLFASYGKLARN